MHASSQLEELAEKFQAEADRLYGEAQALRTPEEIAAEKEKIKRFIKEVNLEFVRENKFKPWTPK